MFLAKAIVFNTPYFITSNINVTSKVIVIIHQINLPHQKYHQQQQKRRLLSRFQ